MTRIMRLWLFRRSARQVMERGLSNDLSPCRDGQNEALRGPAMAE
jgi:hypothetical protein